MDEIVCRVTDSLKEDEIPIPLIWTISVLFQDIVQRCGHSSTIETGVLDAIENQTSTYQPSYCSLYVVTWEVQYISV